MKTLIEALRLLWTGATIGTFVAIGLFLALWLMDLHTPLSNLGMRAVIGLGGALMLLLGALWTVCALLVRASEAARGGQVREVRR